MHQDHEVEVIKLIVTKAAQKAFATKAVSQLALQALDTSTNSCDAGDDSADGQRTTQEHTTTTAEEEAQHSQVGYKMHTLFLAGWTEPHALRRVDETLVEPDNACW
jgi:hypothetical protein